MGAAPQVMVSGSGDPRGPGTTGALPGSYFLQGNSVLAPRKLACLVDAAGPPKTFSMGALSRTAYGRQR